MSMAFTNYRLQDIAEVVGGGTPSTLNEENYDGEIVWITPKDLSNQNGKFIEQGERSISKEGFNACSAQMIPAYNILMSSRAPIGLLAINKVECCTNQGFKSLILNKSICDVDYIYYYLKNHLQEIETLGTGTTFKEVSKGALLHLGISIPSLQEQQMKAKVLSCIDAKIALNRAINHNLEAMAKQLYDYWFVQFDFPNEEGKPYKSSGGAMVYNENLKRNIPKGWNDGIFVDIANITMGQSPDGSSYNETGEGEIFYQGSTDFGIRFPSVRMYTTSPRRYAKQGDILMSVRAPVGAVNIANSDCCIGRGLSAINSMIGSITYIYYVVHYLKVRFDNLNTAGTTFGSITKDELFNLPVVVPSNDVIERFEVICKPIFNKQMEIGFEIESLDKQRNELLPLLMNGQASLNYDLSHD